MTTRTQYEALLNNAADRGQLRALAQLIRETGGVPNALGTSMLMPSNKEFEFPGNKLAVEALAAGGILGGTGTVYKTGVMKVGGIIRSTTIIDLTGLSSSTTDLDIIGQGALAAHIGQYTLARNGIAFGGYMTCLEVPAGGVTDIDLYYATEGTGVFDGLVTALTEIALITKGSAWTLNQSIGIADPAALADKYLYLTCGAAGTPAAYTAGKFLLEIFGYDA